MFYYSIYNFYLVSFEIILSFFYISFWSCRILACYSLFLIETIDVLLPFYS